MARRQALDEVELIEIIDPLDLDAPWDATAPAVEHRNQPSPRSPDRRATIGLAVVAALVAVAWVAVTWAGKKEPPPPPPTGRFVLEREGFEPYSADLVGDDTAGRAFAMWADNGDASLTVTARRGERVPLVLASQSVDLIDGTTVVRTVGPDGIAEATVERSLREGWQAVVTGRGLTAADVAAAADVVRVRERADGTVIELADRSFVSRLRPVLDGVSAEHEVRGAVDSVMRYRAAGRAEYTLEVALGEGRTGVARAREALALLGTDLTSSDGRVAARTPVDGGSVVVWAEGDALVSLSGPDSPERLLDISRAVRAATADEWLKLLRGLHPDLRLGEASVIDTGEDGRGDWTAGAQRVVEDGETRLQWWFSEPDDPAAVRSMPATPLNAAGLTIDTFVVDGVTYAFVQATPAMAQRTISLSQFGDGPPPFAVVHMAPAYLDDDTVMGVVRFIGAGTIRMVSGT